MRFNLLARRITLAPTLALALALTVAACSQQQFQHVRIVIVIERSGRLVASSPPVRPLRAARAPASSSAAVAQITANWEKFFSSSTSAAEKVTLLAEREQVHLGHQRVCQFPWRAGSGPRSPP